MICRPYTPRLPSGPLRALTYLKYASIPLASGAYDETGPLNGNDPPIVIDRLVTPGVAVGRSDLASAAGSATISAMPSTKTPKTTFFMRFLLPDSATTLMQP